MPRTYAAKSTSPRKRVRAQQERATHTRMQLLDAGLMHFSSRGYDAVSVRELESAAGVQRNLLSYHFGDKAGFWKAVADNAFDLMRQEFEAEAERLGVKSDREIVESIVRFYVQFHAGQPELSRLVAQEATQSSWRLEYMIEHHIKRSALEMERRLSEAISLAHDDFVHWYYIMISSSSTIYSFAAECQSLFGVDPCEDKRVKRHADMLVGMLLENDA